MKAIKDSDEKLIMEGVKLLDFWAPWCGPCVSMNPILERLEKEFVGKAEILKINADEENYLCEKYGIRGLPTFVLLKNGKISEVMIGAQREEKLKTALKKLTEVE